MRRGFTLIELLVVVGIISILAAIAVPNFLLAQTRSKVSRVANDLRVLAGALEAYTADTNRYMTGRVPGGDGGFSGVSVFNPDLYVAVSGRFIRLTTPVAYLTSVFSEPFAPSSTMLPGANASEYDSYDYMCSLDLDADKDPEHRRGASLTSGAVWRLSSAGPDCAQYFGGSWVGFCPNEINALGVDYDPTNGTRSAGDIVRIGGGAGVLYTRKPAFDRVRNICNL